MRRPRKRSYPAVVTAALAMVGLVLFVGCGRQSGGNEEATARQEATESHPAADEDAAKRAIAERQMGGRARPAAAYDAGLGAQLMPNMGEPRGDKVVGFRAGSPLRRLGCQQGDILVSCNGEPVAGSKVRKAMEELEKKGTPLVLVIYRGGVKKEITYTKLPPERPMGPEGKAAPPRQGGEACAPGTTTEAEGYAKTEEFGEKGAKLEIVAVLPIMHHCHDGTASALRQAYDKHPKDIHLTIIDLFGPEGPKGVQMVGGGQRAVVAINGKTEFELGGRRVQFERMEGGRYRVEDVIAVIEQELER